MANPVMVASGTFGYGQEYADLLDLRRLGAVVVKGIRLEPWPGNPLPRMVEVPAGLVNAIGLQGSVYLTIPRAGVGQIQAVVQQRLTHVDAVARDGEPIATGERVTIVGIGSDNRLIVERVQDGAEGAGSNGRQ